MIFVLIKSAKKFGLKEKLLRNWTEELLKKYKLDNCEVSLFFVEPKEIQLLNNQYRKINEPTSVLTFFQGQAYPLNQQKRITPEKQNSVKDSVLLLGDIVICPLVEKRKNLSIKFLIEHGLRNLLSEIPTTKSLRT